LLNGFFELNSYLEVAAHEDGKGDSVDEHKEDDIGEGKRALRLERKTDSKLYSGIHAHVNRNQRVLRFCFRFLGQLGGLI
jgi:hypothetical protein